MNISLEQLRTQFVDLLTEEINGAERQELIRAALFRLFKTQIVEHYFADRLSEVADGTKRLDLFFKKFASEIDFLEGLFTSGELDDHGELEIAFEALRANPEIHSITDLLALDIVQLDDGSEEYIGTNFDSGRFEEDEGVGVYHAGLQELMTAFPDLQGKLAERITYFRSTHKANEPQLTKPKETRFHPPIAQA